MLNTTEAAKQLGVSKSYLEKLRVQGGGPRFVKFSKSVRYDEDDLREYKQSKKQLSTSGRR